MRGTNRRVSLLGKAHSLKLPGFVAGYPASAPKFPLTTVHFGKLNSKMDFSTSIECQRAAMGDILGETPALPSINGIKP